MRAKDTSVFWPPLNCLMDIVSFPPNPLSHVCDTSHQRFLSQNKIKYCSGWFDPSNSILYNKIKQFSGWPQIGQWPTLYISYNKSRVEHTHSCFSQQSWNSIYCVYRFHRCFCRFSFPLSPLIICAQQPLLLLLSFPPYTQQTVLVKMNFIFWESLCMFPFFISLNLCTKVVALVCGPPQWF